jgi:hypothetical protein
MRGFRAFTIALLTSLVGGALALFTGDYLTRLYHVSDMEGQRGMTIIFLFAPLGIIVGFVLGFVTALYLRRPGFVGFAKTQALSILVRLPLPPLFRVFSGSAPTIRQRLTAKNLFSNSNFAFLPPSNFPLNLMTTGFAPVFMPAQEIIVLHRSMSDQRKRSTITSPSQENTGLLSQTAQRSLLISVGDTPVPSQMIHINLPASPRKENKAWSDWTFATQRADLTPIPEPQRIAGRYRVQTVDD